MSLHPLLPPRAGATTKEQRTILGPMFSVAYVVLPFSERSPAEAIRASLARFERGGRGDVPEDWLTFHDETAHVRTMHEAVYRFTSDKGLRVEGGETWHLDTR